MILIAEGVIGIGDVLFMDSLAAIAASQRHGMSMQPLIIQIN